MAACYLLTLRKCMSERRPCAPWMVFTSTARTTLASRPSTKQESASTARPWSSKRPRVRPFSSIPQSESCEASKPEVAPPVPRSAAWPWLALHPGTGAREPMVCGCVKPKSPQRQCKWLGPSASFDNALNKLPLKKRKHEGLKVPPHVRPMCLGSRAGSPSPPSTAFASVAQLLLSCLLVLACSRGWAGNKMSLTHRVSSGWGARAVQRGPASHPCSPSMDCFHFTPKRRPAAPGLRLPVGTRQDETINSTLPCDFVLASPSRRGQNA